MDKPLSIWYCDICGNTIQNPRDGYVIWKRDKDSKYFDFTIIHQGSCDTKTHPCSLALPDFLGDHGIALLTSMLSAGPVMDAKGADRILDKDEFVDFFRRVQTPYYEEARRLFSNNDLQIALHGSNELYPYQPDVLKGLIEQFG